MSKPAAGGISGCSECGALTAGPRTSNWSPTASLSCNCTASKWNTITGASEIRRTGRTATAYCSGSKWRTSMPSWSGRRKWASRSCCRSTRIRPKAMAARTTGSAGCAIRTAIRSWSRARTGRPAGRGVRGRGRLLDLGSGGRVRDHHTHHERAQHLVPHRLELGGAVRPVVHRDEAQLRPARQRHAEAGIALALRVRVFLLQPRNFEIGAVDAPDFRLLVRLPLSQRVEQRVVERQFAGDLERHREDRDTEVAAFDGRRPVVQVHRALARFDDPVPRIIEAHAAAVDYANRVSGTALPRVPCLELELPGVVHESILTGFGQRKKLKREGGSACLSSWRPSRRACAWAASAAARSPAPSAARASAAYTSAPPAPSAIAVSSALRAAAKSPCFARIIPRAAQAGCHSGQRFCTASRPLWAAERSPASSAAIAASRRMPRSSGSALAPRSSTSRASPGRPFCSRNNAAWR